MTNVNTNQDKWSNWSLKSMGFVWQLDQDFVLGHSVGSFMHPKAIFTQKNELDVPKTWKHSTHQSMDARKKKCDYDKISMSYLFSKWEPHNTHTVQLPYQFNHQSWSDLSVHTKQRWIWQNGQWQHWNCKGFLQDQSVKSFKGCPSDSRRYVFCLIICVGGVDSEALSRENQQSTTSEWSCHKCNRLLRSQWFQIQKLNEIKCRFVSTYTANVTFVISYTSYYFLQLERTAPYMVRVLSITSMFWILKYFTSEDADRFILGSWFLMRSLRHITWQLTPLTVSVVFRDSSRRVVLSFHFTDVMDENVHRKEASQRNMFPPVRRWFSLTILRIVGRFSKDPSFEKKRPIKQLELT